MTVREIKVWNAATSSWEPVGLAAPDIESAVSKTLVDAKGDILVGSADNSISRLSVGDDQDVLVADSEAPLGVAWRKPGGLENVFLMMGA